MAILILCFSELFLLVAQYPIWCSRIRILYLALPLRLCICQALPNTTWTLKESTRSCVLTIVRLLVFQILMLLLVGAVLLIVLLNCSTTLCAAPYKLYFFYWIQRKECITLWIFVLNIVVVVRTPDNNTYFLSSHLAYDTTNNNVDIASLLLHHGSLKFVRQCRHNNGLGMLL